MNRHNGRTVSPGHTEEVFDPNDFQKLVNRVAKEVRRLQRTHKINALAACGNSGLLLVGALGYKLDLPFLAVRKRMDTNNDWHHVNGFLVDGGTRYLIIDDLISTGKTMTKIIHRLQELACDQNREAKAAAILLYNDNGDDTFGKDEIPVFYC